MSCPGTTSSGILTAEVGVLVGRCSNWTDTSKINKSDDNVITCIHFTQFVIYQQNKFHKDYYYITTCYSKYIERFVICPRLIELIRCDERNFTMSIERFRSLTVVDYLSQAARETQLQLSHLVLSGSSTIGKRKNMMMKHWVPKEPISQVWPKGYTLHLGSS